MFYDFYTLLRNKTNTKLSNYDRFTLFLKHIYYFPKVLLYTMLIYSEIRTRNPDKLYWLAHHFKKRKNHEQAVKLLNEMLSMNKSDARAYFLLGEIYLEKGELLLAEQYYQKVIELEKAIDPEARNRYVMEKIDTIHDKLSKAK